MKRKKDSEQIAPVRKKSTATKSENELINLFHQIPKEKDLLPKYEDILKPLWDKGAIVASEKNTNIQDLYNKFIDSGEVPSFDQKKKAGTLNLLEKRLNKAIALPRAPQRQLAQFMTNQLATLGDDPRGEKNSVSFNKLNLLDKRDISQDDNDNERYNAPFLSRYSPEEKSIYLNFAMPAVNRKNRGFMNPLSKFIHESTHGLDDLSIHSQIAGIDRLKRMYDKAGKPKNIAEFIKPIYEQAQAILPSDSFRKLYNYEEYGEPNLRENFNKIKRPKTLAHAQKILNQPNIDSKLFAEPFTEFIAHAMQNLHQPWNISNNPQLKDGRSFLKAMFKDSYRGFQKLDRDFSTKYPEANRNILDRITELRNYDKYPTADDYLEKRRHTLKPNYIPKYNPRRYYVPTQQYPTVKSWLEAPRSPEYPSGINPITEQLTPMQQQNTDLTAFRDQYEKQFPDAWPQELIDQYLKLLNSQTSQVNPAAYNPNTNPITQPLAPTQPQNMPLDGRPHPVDNSYYNNPPPGDSVPPYLQNPYPRTPSPKI